MRTETYTVNVYQFNELSESAKDKVREWYQEEFHDAYTFEENCVDYLDGLFRGDGSLEVTFDYDYDDTTYIYGKLNMYNLIENCEQAGYISKDEASILSYCIDIDNFGDYLVNIPKNDAENIDEYIEDDIDDILDNLHEEYKDGSPVTFDDPTRPEASSEDVLAETLESFKTTACEYIDSLIDSLSKYGYDWFNSIDDEEIEDICDVNEYEFTEDGELV